MDTIITLLILLFDLGIILFLFGYIFRFSPFVKVLESAGIYPGKINSRALSFSAFIADSSKLRQAVDLKRIVEKSRLPANTTVFQSGSIETLELKERHIAMLSPEIGRLRQLKILDLQENILEKVPPEIGQLRQLQVLNLNGNQLQMIPREIYRLKQLQRLRLDRNRLREVPSGIGHLRKLESLRLSRNQLSSIPASIGRLRNLRSLFLDFNKLTAVPEQLGQLQNLQILHLNGNPLPEKRKAEDPPYVTPLRYLLLRDSWLENLRLSILNV